MTRDAEHTPSPKSVVVPGSAWERFLYRSDFLRGAAVVDGHDVSLRSFASLVEELKAAAALSPEAPAREGVVQWQAIDTAPTTKGKYLFCLLAWGPEEDKTTAFGFRFDGKWYAAPAFYKSARFDECQYELRQIEVSPTHWAEMPAANALTPRHEAPADSDAVSVPRRILNDVIRNQPGWLDSVRRYAEAPAEGAGELIQRIVGNCGGFVPKGEDLRLCVEALEAAFRARSSAPEAREEALGNLLAVIHGDGGHRELEVGVEQAAAEAEKIVARLLSSAPEAREREAWPERWSGPCTVGNMISNLRTLPPEMPLYSAYHIPRDDQPSLLKVKRPTLSRERVDGTNIKTGDESIPYSAVIWSQPRDPEEAHPAAPSADKLRLAVEALDKISLNAYARGRARVIAAEALAVLKAEGAK